MSILRHVRAMAKKVVRRNIRENAGGLENEKHGATLRDIHPLRTNDN